MLQKILQYALDLDPLNKPVRKKLVICYLQIGEIQKALNIFYNLITEDIDCIINTDPVSDDCPCPDLVKALWKHSSIRRELYRFKNDVRNALALL